MAGWQCCCEARLHGRAAAGSITYVVGLARLSHVIAGSVEVLYLVTTGALPFTAFLGSYLAPTFLGNTIGGVSLVAALNHAQVVSGQKVGG